MELTRCAKGHEYDAALAECPECAALAGRTVPLMDNPYGSFGSYGPAGSYGGMNPTEPMIGETEPVNPKPTHWADQKYYGDAGRMPDMADDYGKTMPMVPAGGFQEGTAVLPVTGWLVCIDGPEKGRDYRIHAENNYIGRSSKMDICLASDGYVSRENHAIIAYDTRDRMFFFAPLSGASIVRHNGRAVLNNVELKRGDRIEIGKGTFLFVPLCGEDFQW